MSKLASFTGIALKNLFSKPATTKYPEVPREYPERTRGHVAINIDDCILCGMCMRNCPPGAIKVDRAASTWSIQRFDCVQCGYCTEVCPKKCLSMVPGYPEPQPEKQAEVHQKPVVEKTVTATGKTAATGKTTVAGNAAEDGKTTTSGSAGLHPQADTSVCVFCTLCAKKCPVSALTVDREQKVWKVDADTCIGCGLCEQNCPKKCISMI